MLTVTASRMVNVSEYGVDVCDACCVALVRHASSYSFACAVPLPLRCRIVVSACLCCCPCGDLCCVDTVCACVRGCVCCGRCRCCCCRVAVCCCRCVGVVCCALSPHCRCHWDCRACSSCHAPCQHLCFSLGCSLVGLAVCHQACHVGFCCVDRGYLICSCPCYPPPSSCLSHCFSPSAALSPAAHRRCQRGAPPSTLWLSETGEVEESQKRAGAAGSGSAGQASEA